MSVRSFIPCLLMFALGFAIACDPTPRANATERATEAAKRRQRLADEVIDATVFVRDVRLLGHQCFAYSFVWAGSSGRQAMRTIDCDDVPPELLVTVPSSAR